MKSEFDKDILKMDKKRRFQPEEVNDHLRSALMETLNGSTANDMQSFRPVHPGELLKDELEYRRLSQRMISQRLGLPYTAFNEILNGKRPVTTDFALMMEAALGVPAYLLVGLQTDYNLQMARKDDKLNKRLMEIRKVSALF